jgi:sialate O-acetylesterase
MTRPQCFASLVGLVTLLCLAGQSEMSLADVRLPHIFGNHMVLQRGLPIHLWGWADANEKVKVSIGKEQAETTADEHGKWKVELPAVSATAPIDVTIEGKNTIALHDVLIGEVWLCSGQSNMQFSVASVEHSHKEIEEANHPNIRLFTVPMRPAGEPASDVDASWTVCSPQTVPGFAAVGYFFGRYLHEQLNVPVGLINSSWGGTRIEPWTPPVGFREVPALASIAKQIEEPRKRESGSPRLPPGPPIRSTTTSRLRDFITG